MLLLVRGSLSHSGRQLLMEVSFDASTPMLSHVHASLDIAGPPWASPTISEMLVNSEPEDEDEDEERAAPHLDDNNETLPKRKPKPVASPKPSATVTDDDTATVPSKSLATLSNSRLAAHDVLQEFKQAEVELEIAIKVNDNCN